ncbi:unnamed protein product, partial [Polarella glacialis]
QEAVQKIVASLPEFREAARSIGSLGRRAGGVRAAANALESAADHGVMHLQTIADLNPEAARTKDVLLAILGVPTLLVLLWRWGAPSPPPSVDAGETGPGCAPAPSQAARKKRA